MDSDANAMDSALSFAQLMLPQLPITNISVVSDRFLNPTSSPTTMKDQQAFTGSESLSRLCCAITCSACQEIKTSEDDHESPKRVADEQASF